MWWKSPHDRLSCGKLSPHGKCGEKSIQWGNFPHEKCGHKSVLSQFTLFSCKIWFVTIYAVLSQHLFCCDLRAFVWRKIEPKIVLVERKKTNIRYAYYEPSPVLIRALPPDAIPCHSSSRQEIPAVQCPLRQSCSPGGHQVVQLSIQQQWRHEKSKWEGRKNTLNR